MPFAALRPRKVIAFTKAVLKFWLHPFGRTDLVGHDDDCGLRLRPRFLRASLPDGRRSPGMDCPVRADRDVEGCGSVGLCRELGQIQRGDARAVRRRSGRRPARVRCPRGCAWVSSSHRSSSPRPSSTPRSRRRFARAGAWATSSSAQRVLTSRDIAMALAAQLGLRTIDLARHDLDVEIAGRLPDNFAELRCWRFR